MYRSFFGRFGNTLYIDVNLWLLHKHSNTKYNNAFFLNKNVYFKDISFSHLPIHSEHTLCGTAKCIIHLSP